MYISTNTVCIWRHTINTAICRHCVCIIVYTSGYTEFIHLHALCSVYTYSYCAEFIHYVKTVFSSGCIDRIHLVFTVYTSGYTDCMHQVFWLFRVYTSSIHSVYIWSYKVYTSGHTDCIHLHTQ